LPGVDFVCESEKRLKSARASSTGKPVDVVPDSPAPANSITFVVEEPDEGQAEGEKRNEDEMAHMRDPTVQNTLESAINSGYHRKEEELTCTEKRAQAAEPRVPSEGRIPPIPAIKK